MKKQRSTEEIYESLYGFDFFKNGHVLRKDSAKRFSHNGEVEQEYITNVVDYKDNIVIYS